MTESVAIFLGVGLAICLGAIAVLGWLLGRERAARRAADAALAARQDEAAERAARLALLDRRRAAIAPIDALWLIWSRDCRPDEDALDCAIRAIAEARLIFPEAIQAELDEAAALIADHLRGHAWQREAVRAGRHAERAELMDAEFERERDLRPRIAGLRVRLADAARLA